MTATMAEHRSESTETIRAIGIAAGAALLIISFGPPPGDASAHLYRTWLVEHNQLLWDNLWFTGNYSTLTYSPLYYFLAAALGTSSWTWRLRC